MKSGVSLRTCHAHAGTRVVPGHSLVVVRCLLYAITPPLRCVLRDGRKNCDTRTPIFAWKPRDDNTPESQATTISRTDYCDMNKRPPQKSPAAHNNAQQNGSPQKLWAQNRVLRWAQRASAATVAQNGCILLFLLISSIFLSSVASSRSDAFRKSICAQEKSPRIYTSMHSGRFKLMKLTYTRLEDNLIRHRGDRLSYIDPNAAPAQQRDG